MGRRNYQFRPWLNMQDAVEIYYWLSGTSEGEKVFREKAKKIAVKSKGVGAYIFQDEEALFELLKECCPTAIERRRYKRWADIVQNYY